MYSNRKPQLEDDDHFTSLEEREKSKGSQKDQTSPSVQ